MAKKKTDVFDMLAKIENTDLSTDNNDAKNEKQCNTQNEDEDVEILKNEIFKLSNEKNELLEKLSTYIEDKSAISSEEFEKLKKEKDCMQKEIDDCLMKISELTFENAKLTSQNQQLKCMLNNQQIDNTAAPIEVQCSKNNNIVNSKYVPYKHNDGYVYWN